MEVPENNAIQTTLNRAGITKMAFSVSRTVYPLEIFPKKTAEIGIQVSQVHQ